jgi:3',5'-nucleoside bisphosphate phosphatase
MAAVPAPAPSVEQPTFDLQSHSTRSDGTLPPADVVRRAAAAGVELLALTDHDTVDGVDEALETAAAEGLLLVPATELSALDGELEDVHILGYGIDHRQPALLEALAGFRADRVARAERMAAAMRDLGWVVELPDAGDRPIGRPHLSRAVFDHPQNRMRLAEEGLVNFSQLLEAYLIPGRPGYRRRETPTVAEAIALVHDAGGVAVWAHPFWDLDHDDEVLDTVERFAALGIDGVEAFYATHTREQTVVLARRCEDLGLLTTGSADFHGPEHPQFSSFRAFALHGCEPRLGPIA